MAHSHMYGGRRARRSNPYHLTTKATAHRFSSSMLTEGSALIHIGQMCYVLLDQRKVEGGLKVKRGFLTGLAAAALVAVPLQAQAKEPAGYVDSKRGTAGTEVWITRKGKKIKARAGTVLYAGDVVSAKGSGNRVTVRMAGARGRKTVKAGSSLTIPAAKKKSWSATFAGYMRSIGYALGMTDRQESQGTWTRSGPSDGTVTEFEPLAKLDLLDAPTLFASHDLGQLMLRWCGDAGGVDAQAEGPNREGQMEEFNLIGYYKKEIAFGTVTLKGLLAASEKDEVDGPERIVLKSPVVDQDDVSMALQWIALDAVPRPFKIADADLQSDEIKAEWGGWLLQYGKTSGDKRYNLIALNLLGEAADGAWEAGYVLDQATTCPIDRANVEG